MALSKNLLAELDLDVLKALEVAEKIKQGTVAFRPREARLAGGLLVLESLCEKLILDRDQVRSQLARDRQFIGELRRFAPADMDRQARDYMAERS